MDEKDHQESTVIFAATLCYLIVQTAEPGPRSPTFAANIREICRGRSFGSPRRAAQPDASRRISDGRRTLPDHFGSPVDTATCETGFCSES